MVFGSEMEETAVFKHWVARERLVQIRKTGSYMSNEEAASRIRDPTGETTLHYIVYSYIARTYPDVVISPGYNENRTT